MTRLRDQRWHYEPNVDLTIALILGPSVDGDVEQLEAAWRVERESLLENCRRNPIPGWRPWGWWVFEAGGEPPADEVEEAARLAAMGELSPDEFTGLEDRARGSERWAKVLEAVEAARPVQGLPC